MKKISPIIWKIAYDLSFIVAAVQILLGLCWAVVNLDAVPMFAETKLLLEVSETWLLDEYIGAGYVALIWLAKVFNRVLGIPYQVWIYLLQFGISCFVAYRLLSSIVALQMRSVKRINLLFAALFVNTIPFLLQGHFAVLPYSLSGSAYLLLFSFLLDMVRKVRDKKSAIEKKTLFPNIVAVLLCWLFGALLIPKYLWLSGMLVCLCFIYVGLLQQTTKGMLTIVIVMGVLLGGVSLLLTTEEGARGRVSDSLESQAMRRFAWSYLERMESVWPWDIVVEFSEEELKYSAVSPERTMEIFGPRVERLYGKETAELYFSEMAKAVLVYNTKEAIREISADMVFYLCPQGASMYHLQGRGASYTGQSYGKMQENGGEIASLLLEWSGLAFVLQGLMGALQLMRTRAWEGWLWIAGVGVFSQALCWTWLTAGAISYLVCPVNMVLWGALLTTWLWADRKIGAEAV